MAAFNGSTFIGDQIKSILPQLANSDELVVVDDASTDDTVAVVRSFQDGRIRIAQNASNLGVLKTFERALEMTGNELVFLCDQDDIWGSNKIARFEAIFKQDPLVTMVLSDANVINGKGERTADSWFETRPFVPGVLANIFKNRYLGCTMAFRRWLLSYVLPFPADIPMHDMWLGLMNQIYGKVAFVAEPLISYRRHEANTTTPHHASVTQMLAWRVALTKNLVVRALTQSASRKVRGWQKV